MIVVDEFASIFLRTLGIGTEVDVDFRAGTAGTGIAHLPEVVMLVAVDDMIGREMLFPISSSLVVAAQTFLRRAFENGGIKTFRVKFKHIDKIFPRPINRFFLEIIAETPVSEHLEHGVVVGIHSNLFKVVVLAADTQTLLRVGHTLIFSGFVTEDNIFELVHAGIGEHQGRIVLDHHRSGGHDAMSFVAEEILEGFAYFFSCKHFLL